MRPSRRPWIPALSLSLGAFFALSGCEITIEPDIPYAEDTGNPYWDIVEDTGAAEDTRPDPDTLLPDDTGGEDTQTRPDTALDEDAPTYIPDADTTDVPDPIEDPPQISLVWPNHGPSRGGTQVIVDGRAFAYDSIVRLGGETVEDVDVIDPFQIWLETPPMEAGTYDLKVITAAGSAVYPDAFTFEASLELDVVSPSVGAATGGYEVDIDGAGFERETRFVFAWDELAGCGAPGAVEAEVNAWIGDDLVRVVMPAVPQGCTVDLYAYDTRYARLEDAFTFEDVPRLDAVRPAQGDYRGGERVALSGVGFDEACVVHFGSRDVSLERDDAGWFVTTPGSGVGTVDVTVDCGDRGASRRPEAFTYVYDTSRALVRIDPATGSIDGGERAWIEGFDLAEADVVAIGGVDTTILRAEDTVIEVLTPALAAGVHAVDVGFGDDTLTLEDAYTALALPTFSELRPDQGLPDESWIATVSGSGLDRVEAVVVGGEVRPLASQSPTSIRFRVPPGPAGDTALIARVEDRDVDTGLVVTRAFPLSFSTFFPTTGSTGGGSLVYVAGHGFTDACLVELDGVGAATQRIGESLLVAVVPPHAAGDVTLEVLGCGARWIAETPYTYEDPTRYPGGVSGSGIDGEVRVSVRDIQTFAPIEGATVVIGVRDNTELTGVTGADGLVTLVDPELVGPQTITAFAPERSVESIHDVDARDVTLLLYPLPPPPCDDPTDPACAPPEPEPTGEIIGFLSGMYKIADFPPGTHPYAVVETTRVRANYGNPSPGDDNTLTEDGPFRLDTRLGEMALVALCGYAYDSDGTFVPLMMGVVRNVRLRPGDDAYRTTIECNIPLNEALTLKLTQAPALQEGAYPEVYRAAVTLDFGAEGAFQGLPPAEGTTSTFTGGEFPPLDGALQGVTLDIVAGAYRASSTWPRSQVYVYGLPGYDELVTTAPMLSPPTVTTPAVDEETGLATLVDGFVEWEVIGRQPDLFHVTMSSQNTDFMTWSVYLPGWTREFNITQFQACEGEACAPSPGDAERSISFYVRAIDAVSFDMNDFDRYVLGSSSWRASAVTYQNVLLTNGAEVEDETTDP